MANKTHVKGNIYSLAKVAKERLKQNNYTKTNSTKINNASSFVSYISNQKKSKQDLAKQKVLTSSYDEKLYQKVCYLIETKNTANPISFLIDKNLFCNLDCEAKQYYISNLTQKYKFLRLRYFREHQNTFFI